MSAGALRLTVPEGADGVRLDRFLAEAVQSRTRSSLRRLIVEGRVTVDGRTTTKPGAGLKPGMEVGLELPAPPAEELVGESIPVEILHRDEHLVVVNKPAGLVVHPGHGNRTGTLVHALLGMNVPLAAAGGRDRPGIVHRLDRDTSGAMVVALTDAAHQGLARAFAGRAVTKVYRALVWGHLRPPQGRIERPIGRSRSDPTRMTVHAPRSRPAATAYRTLETMPGFALLELLLESGRTHQIRVHLLSLQHPVVGDRRYGGQPWRRIQDARRREALRRFDRLALHAWRLSFPHPITGETVTVTAPVPEDFASLVSVLRRAA